MGRGGQPIQWYADDPDGDLLTFSILYSGDGGETWGTFTSDVQGLFFEADSSALPASHMARIRVLASDGLNTSHADSALFSVGNKPPLVAIAEPQDGQWLPARRALMLSAQVFDVEDGTVPPERLEWTSDRQGFLAQGASLPIPPLQPDRHNITLTAIDNQSAHSSATVSVYVGHPLYVPMILRE